MQPKSWLFVLIALAPVYITLAFYPRLAPASSAFQINLSSLLRLSRATLKNYPSAFLASASSRLSTSTPISTNMKFVPRPNEERGHADHDWLKTFHTFSFAMYQDNKHQQYGALRVINEDRVAPKTGFGTHSHREFEIFSYIVSGTLEHKDSMGNTELLTRGAVQLTSAGTGISHSEKSPGPSPAHFLQIWSVPHTSRLQPKYYTRQFSDEDKKNKFVPVVAPAGSEGVNEERDGKGPAPVQSALTMYATLIEKGNKVEQVLKGKKGYVHLIQTGGYNPGQAKGATVRVGGVGDSLELKEGDGAYISLGNSGQTTFAVENVGEGTAEVLVFDLD